MLTMSKPLSAGQLVAYHKSEFSNARDNYYSQNDTVIGQWAGALAQEWGLSGDIDPDTFARLAEGQHPVTGAQLVQHQTSREATNANGVTTKTMEHRAGWDATFSAPKSVSLTALVGGDAAVRAAHEAAVDRALLEFERYAQARMGGNAVPLTTGKLAMIKFEHDSARPVKGYAAPQIHTHVVVFNVTAAGDDTRPLQPRQLYKTQRLATNIYRSELALRLQRLGYKVERGEKGAPELVGYSKEYLEASSPRRNQILERLAEIGMTGAEAASIVATQTRDKKVNLSHAEVQRAHQEMAAKYGHQPERVVKEALTREPMIDPGAPAESAVAFARDVNIERDAVIDERKLVGDALERSMGHRTVEEIQQTFEQWVSRRDFIEVPQKPGIPARHFTTPGMQTLEQDNIDLMRHGQGQARPLVAANIRRDIEEHYPHLSDHQREGVEQVLASRDRCQAFNGAAGTGKTTVLTAIADAAVREGFAIHGFAPTSRATQLLVDAGIPAMTLQRYLATHPEPEGGKALHIIDESSLASTPQVHTFLQRLPPGDRVLLVGDTRQHEAVEAGTPFKQLIDSGIHTTNLTQIVRQQDQELKAVVEHLADGQIKPAIALLEAQGRVHQVPHRGDRYRAIAAEYVKDPKGTLVVSPDNQSRRELNHVIHKSMQAAGQVATQQQPATVLVQRQDLTGADRAWAARYEVGDVARYSKGSKAHGIKSGAYGRIIEVNVEANRVGVRLDDSLRTVRYDPRRLQGVTVYREDDRAFAVGDRVQFTAPYTAPGKTVTVANRTLGTITAIDVAHLAVETDAGKTVHLSTFGRQHLDHGYAVTSHSSQGETTNRVLVHVDTNDQVGTTFANQRLAYVAGSRSRYDIQIFTDDKVRLPQVLNRQVTQQTALGTEHRKAEAIAQTV